MKIRTGLDPERRNGVEIARIAEAEGAQALVVHGRTRACRFVGAVEHRTVAAIKAAVGIPVFANGDIDSREAAERIMADTGVDGVMIGRAALGAPWLPGQIAGVVDAPDLDEKLSVMREHVALGHEFYGENACRIMRKHVQWYFEAMQELETPEWRRAAVRDFNRLPDNEAQERYLARLVEERPHRAAA